MDSICKDLAAEYGALDEIVKDLDEATWQKVTPFDEWTIKDEISHLAYFDRAAFLSATDPEAFNRDMEQMLAGFTDFDQMHRKINARGNAMSPPELLAWWRRERESLLAAFAARSPKDRLPWYGPAMSARSSATARMMETWAHGQDIVDALGIRREPTDRLRHIAHLGVRTFGWSFQNRQLPVPDKPVRVELTSPSGDMWHLGADGAAEVVSGPALDFCLVVTQRRHWSDTDLTVQGEIAQKWLDIAQVFAGPAEDGPKPGERI